MRQSGAVREKLREGDFLKIGVKSRCNLGKDVADRRRPGQQAAFDQHANQRRRHGLGARADVNLVGHPHWLRRSDLAQADRSNGGQPLTGENRADHAGEMMAAPNRFEQLVECLIGPWRQARASGIGRAVSLVVFIAGLRTVRRVVLPLGAGPVWPSAALMNSPAPPTAQAASPGTTDPLSHCLRPIIVSSARSFEGTFGPPGSRLSSLSNIGEGVGMFQWLIVNQPSLHSIMEVFASWEHQDSRMPRVRE